MPGEKLKKDILLNMVLSFVLIISILWVVRMAGLIFEPVTLGIFMFSRRLAETLANALQLGSSFTLRRYLPMNDRDSVKLVYVISGLALLVLVAMIFCVGLLSGLRFWTQIVFQAKQGWSETLMFWIAMLALTTALNYQVVSILIAYRFVLGFSIVNLLNISTWLILGMWWWGKQSDVQILLSFQAIASGVLSAGVIYWTIAHLIPAKVRMVSLLEIRQALKEYISYGLPRAISTFIEMLFYLVGPWLIRKEIEAAGYLIISFMFLRVARMIVRPVSTIIGVVAAKLVGRNDQESLRYGISLLFGSLFYLGIVLSILMYSWIQPLLQIWLGKPQLVKEVHNYVTVISMAVLPFIIFQGLKEVIEMIWKRPRNLYTVIFAILCFVIVFFGVGKFLPASQSALCGYLVSLWIMGLMTIWWIHRYLKSFKYFGLSRFFLLMTIVGLLNIGLARYMISASLLENMTIAIVSMGLSIVVLFIGLCLYKPAAFVVDTLNFFWPRLEQGRF
jgi:O-antigen/teichoic acid export membrane protein